MTTTPTQESCPADEPFCNICYAFSHSADPSLTPEYEKLCNSSESRLVYNDSTGAIFVALGPLVPGNLMIVPRHHYTATRQMDPRSLRDLSELMEVSRIMVETAFGPAMLFEHGTPSVPDDTYGSCIDHVHVQILPRAGSVIRAIKDDLGPGERVGSIIDVPSTVKREPYLYIHDFAQEVGWVFTSRKVPSQYFRKKHRELLPDSRSWNWRISPACDLIQATMEGLSRS